MSSIFFNFYVFLFDNKYGIISLMFSKISRKMNIIIAILIAFSMLSCSSNPNSTLNHSPMEVKMYKEKEMNESDSASIIDGVLIDKNFGEGYKDIVIFSTNDSFSSYNDNLGYASIKHYIDNFDRNENFVTLVDTGNFSTGSAIAIKSKGKSSIEIMNAIGYDIVVPGSHEFDYGLDTFYENMEMLDSDILCCNIYDVNKKTLSFIPYVIYRYDKTNVAFIGVTSPDVLYDEKNRNYFFDSNGNQLLYFFEDEDGTMLYNQIQACVDSAKSEGADKVVLLSHLGIEGVETKWSSTQVIANTKDIDAVIDGHSMEVLDNGLMTNKIGSFVPLVQAGSHLTNLGAMNITKDGYAYPAVMKERSVNTKDEEFQKFIDNVIEKYNN